MEANKRQTYTTEMHKVAMQFGKYVSLYEKNIMEPLKMRYSNRNVANYIKISNLQKHQFDIAYCPCINPSFNLSKLIAENEIDTLYVDEGLIKTYPAKFALKAFKNFCKKNIDQKLANLTYGDLGFDKSKNVKVIDSFDKTYQDENNPLDLISFLLPFENDAGKINQILQKLVNDLYVCGYNYMHTTAYAVNKQPFDSNGNISILRFGFEAKYFKQQFKFSKWLYHITSVSSLSKINKNGLIPKSKSFAIQYPDRTYLFNNADKDMILSYMRKKLKSLNLTEGAILKISGAKLQETQLYKSGKLDFYIDSMFDDGINKANAIFTYNNIPRNLIDDSCLIVNIDIDTAQIISQKTCNLEDFLCT